MGMLLVISLLSHLYDSCYVSLFNSLCSYPIGRLCCQGDVWICMELMDTSLDKFYKQVNEKQKTIPEDILGKIAVSVSTSASPTNVDGLLYWALLMFVGHK